jgi:hypothetical protein
MSPPGVLSSGSMWARGRGGGGGGRPLGREAFEQNRRERLAREGPQRPLSERHDELQREGQELSQRLARDLPADVRSSLERRELSGDQGVRARCVSMAEMNEESLQARGDDVRTQSAEFVRRCQDLPPETWECVDRGAEAREDPDCRRHLAVLDREMRTLRRQGEEVQRPAQRIDTLAQDPWETERDRVAPRTLAPETVE